MPPRQPVVVPVIVGLLLAGWGVLGLLAAFAGRYVFSIGANAALAWRALPGLRIRWRDFDRTLLHSFFGYGAGMQLSGLIATALHSADRLLAGVLLGPQAMALVDLAAKLPTTAGSISSSASTAQGTTPPNGRPRSANCSASMSTCGSAKPHEHGPTS